MKTKGRRGKFLRAILLFAAIAIAIASLAACTLADPDTTTKFAVINNEDNAANIANPTRDEAIDTVTDGLDSLREYLDSPDIANTGYYMGIEFHINTEDSRTHVLSNFRLKIQAHLFTYKYEDDEGNMIYKYYDKRDGKYYDAQNADGTRERVSAQSIHNEVIKKSDLLIEWYDGISNDMLIGLYYDGLNGNSEDPGNIMYLNIQGYKRSFYDWGDTVLYQQLIRLLMSLSIEKLMVAANIQGDGGTSSLRSVFELLVTDNYKMVLNEPVTSTLFYDMNATPIAPQLTEFIQKVFRSFRNDLTNEYPLDPFTNKYLGFKFSVMGAANLSTIATDMQFFTAPDPTDGTREILTGAYLTFGGGATSLRNTYEYDSDATFEYGAYPPEDIPLDRDFYTPYKYGKYEFTGNLYVPLINSNFDALIRTDMQQYYNYQNNIFMEYRDIANGELMMGMYYRGDIEASPDVDRINSKGELVHDKQGRTFLDISGMEYLYGWIDLNQLGFPKVYDEHINMADQLDSYHKGVDNAIVSIVDSILSPEKNDKENMLLTYIMRKMSKTEKVKDDIFSRNTETLLVDMQLIKQFLKETGVGDYTTRDVINILDSMLPYTMDQIAIMLGVANAEIMLDNSFFTFRLDVDTNEIRICMYTNVNRTEEEGPLLIFQLDLVPVIVGDDVNIADLNFDNFKPLEQIYTYSATMNGNFIFSTAEVVDLSKLLSATIGENSGLNTPYTLAQNAGITFRLIYDQFVTDHEIEGVMRYQGRSAFELNVWLTGAESSVIIRVASDDVAFSNDVYKDQPARAEELGYVWVSIECVTDNGIQRVPKVKIREDVFMSSMQAYMNGTKISDNAADLGNSEVNLSITSILFALVEDSYVVMEPEQMEITSSNETLQNLFRVKGLIGNIRTNAGFTHRVSGLQSVKFDYGMYQVGQFENIEGNSPYDTELHHTIPVYFYEDYANYHYIKASTDTFDVFAPNKTSEGLDGYNLGQRAKTYKWSSAKDSSDDTERQRMYGIYNVESDTDEKLQHLYTVENAAGTGTNNVFEEFMPEDFNVRAFLTIDGKNSLVMSNKTVYGQAYTKTDPVVIESGTYYKVTFKAKTLLPDTAIAEFKLLQQFFDDDGEEYYSPISTVQVNTSSAPTVYNALDYTVYIYNPTVDYYTAKWAFDLGGAVSGSRLNEGVRGMMVVDEVLFTSVDEEEFLAAQEAYNLLDREGKTTTDTQVYVFSAAGTALAQKKDYYDPLKYDLRVDRARGTIQVYEKGGEVIINREAITDYANDSFFVQEDANNQDISKVRFKIELLPFIYKNGDRYCFLDYEGEEIFIPDDKIKTQDSQTYVYFLGVQQRVHHVGGSQYCYYDPDLAVVDENGDYVYFYTQVSRNFLFEYDEQSIEITEQAKTQYAPRINGSFMGYIRRYILVFTTPYAVERGKLIELNNRQFYNEEDEFHSIQLYDEDGVAVGEPIPDPIVLFVMEPCEPLATEVAVNIQVGNSIEYYVLTAEFVIDWDAITLKGYMEVTEVIVAPGMMGEKTFPVRIIVTNRETIPVDTVTVYVGETDYASENVPVVDVIEIDPYDYLIAKNNFFMEVSNYNPDQYSSVGDDPEYMQKYREAENRFVNSFFRPYLFTIRFDYTTSYLYRNEVKEEYIAVSYSNSQGDHIDSFDWSFDQYSEGNYTEDKIKAIADGNATHSALYVHTYFKGQLVALQVNIGTRKLAYIKFSEDDDFDPEEANGDKQPGDQGYIYGHYVANYYDAESYDLPLNPIFVFTDGAGHYFEKVFDFAYISDIADNGSYVIDDTFGLTWGNPTITYIGANGSYYYREIWCEDLVTAELATAKINVSYCDDNVVKKLDSAGDADISVHDDATVEESILDAVDTVGSTFSDFIDDFSLPGAYTARTIASTDPEYDDYQAFFNAVCAMYEASNNRVSIGLEYDVESGLVLGLTKPVVYLFDETDLDTTSTFNTHDKWLAFVGRLFGFDTVASFKTAIAKLVAEMDDFTITDVQSRLRYDGAVLTQSGLYVLPYAFKYNRLSQTNVVVGSLFVRSDGEVFLWVNDHVKTRTVVNYANVGYDSRPSVKVYGRCQLLEFGKELVNRPFDISHVERDENGNVLNEGDPEEKYPSDVTSSSINWYDIMTIYKPVRVLGSYSGTSTKLHLIAGDETYSGFLTTVVRITVECPKLDVAHVTSDGEDVIEADDLDLDGMGNKVLFTPSYVDFGNGSNPGYYMIDPLDASGLEIPTSVLIGFTDENRTKISGHVFVNIKWRATFDYVDGQYTGDGSLTNDSGVEVLRYDPETGKYYFNQPTDEPMYTRIMAKIGSDLSGYQFITVCVRVLSKDPQEVEFFSGELGSGTRITSIERTDYDFAFSDADKATEFAFYTYYVDTFADFVMPTYIKAYFGVQKERTALYDVTWKAANRVEGLYYSPNTIRNMVAEIGTGDIVIHIYLSVVVANHEIEDIELRSVADGGLVGYYVSVVTGWNGQTPILEYVAIGDILHCSFTGLVPEMGLYYIDDLFHEEHYIYINLATDEEKGLVGGMIPIYARRSGNYELDMQLWPYQFIEQVYSGMTISFKAGQMVDLPDVGEYQARFTNEELGVTWTAKLKDATVIKYSYDASSGKDKLQVAFRYTLGGFDYYMIPDENGLVYIDVTATGVYDTPFTLYELAILAGYNEMAIRYDEKLVEKIVLTDSTEIVLDDDETLRSMYVYSSGRVTFVRHGEEFSPARIVFKDGATASYNELVYRIKYLERHRMSNYIVSTIHNKSTEINDFEGIFYINDVVRTNGAGFMQSNKYVVSLGTGRGAYDVRMKLIFDGGYRMTIDSESNTGEVRDGEMKSNVVIRPYTISGTAQFGVNGFVFGEEFAFNVDAVAQDGRGSVEQFLYGPNDSTKDKLDKWYVEDSSFNEVEVGTFIYRIPQSVIYSPNNGQIIVSTLTKEGFRIRKNLSFDGVPTQLQEYDSTNVAGLLIRNGNINIADIYDYTPMTTYFAGTEYLPTAIRVMLGSSNITVNNVEWKILNSWYGAQTRDSMGKIIGVGELDRMTYNGTYNSSSNDVSKVNIATAEILGWIDGQGVYHDRITITLTITIPSAEIVELPWNEGSLSLDARTITAPEDDDLLDGDGGYRFYVDVDAFNDADSTAISGSNFILPKDIRVIYRSGKEHTFRNVSFMFNDLVVTSIPYTDEGIDIASLAASFGVSTDYFIHSSEKELLFMQKAKCKDYIDLKVNVGLQQILTIRFLFYDKTVDSVSAVLEPNDRVIREQIRTELADTASDKSADLQDRFNATRIKKNIENMYSQARLIRDRLLAVDGLGNSIIPTAEIILGINRSLLSPEYLESLLYVESEYLALRKTVPASEAVENLRSTPYSLNADYNFALEKIRLAAKAAAKTYAQILYENMRSEFISQQASNVTRQMENFVAAVFNNGYDAMIGDYLKLEMKKVFEKELTDSSDAFVTYAIGFKNEAEGSFDYDAALRAVYRLNEKLLFDAPTAAEVASLILEETYVKQELKPVFLNLIYDTLEQAATSNGVSGELYDIVKKIIDIRIGEAEEEVDMASVYDCDCPLDNFIANNYMLDKKELRIAIRNYIGKLFDFTPAGDRPAEIPEMIPLIVADSLNSIQNYVVTVGAIRRNLNTSVDIATMLNTLLGRGIKNFVDGTYMESHIVMAIKRAQSINLQYTSDYGYFFIDPYYDYRMVPSTLVVSFDEQTGGFDYQYGANWISDSVSGKVVYSGNKKLDWFGDLYAYYNAYRTYDENELLRQIMLEEVLPAVSGKSADTILAEVGSRTFAEIRSDLPTIVGRTWTQIRGANVIINDTMLSIESYASTFFNDVREENKEARYLELFLYYRAGLALLDKDDAIIEDMYGMDAAAIRRDYDSYRYDDLSAILYNANTRESQTVSLIVEVKNRSLAQGELMVLDNTNHRVNYYTIANPFEATVDEIPNRILVGDEYLTIHWENVQISPLGNIASGNTTIRGSIGNSGGQAVTLQLYIARWEYAGVYEDIDGDYVLMNTGSQHLMDFYFNEYLTYSAKPDYQIRFNVYKIVEKGNKYVEEFDEYREVTFYPEDSALLVNSEDDSEMSAVNARKKYVIYWDEMAISQIIGNKTSVTGDLSIGNSSIGAHNLTSLSVGSTNATLAKRAAYHYEQMRVDEMALSTLHIDDQDVWQFSVEGTATYVTDLFDTLPESAEIKLFYNNIAYDEDEIEVRILWNKTYNDAINALTKFIEYSFKDVESAARTQYARSLLMDEYKTLRNRTGDVYEAAMRYVQYLDSSLVEEEDIMRAADKLLMVNERYRFANRVEYLRGGSYANNSVAILIRYAGSSSLYVQERFLVRLVFADFSPLAYYTKNEQTGSYQRIDNTIGLTQEELSELYVGVRKDYWDEEHNRNQYDTEGVISPYDNIGDVSYRMLEEKYNINYGSDETAGQRVIRVTDIEYEEGTFRSKSFVIDGVKYTSNLINLP